MTWRRLLRTWLLPALIAVSVQAESAVPAGALLPQAVARAANSIPARLTDQQFWKLSSDFSEPNGYFRSENLVSNEHTFQYVIPALVRQVAPGGVYVGVAPDQNFTYIVATQPRIAFIVDIRRGNLLQHLMYKALIELSADRADFLAKLFSVPRPAGLGPSSTAAELFDGVGRVKASETIYRQNVREMTVHLTKRHGFPIASEDLEQLESIYFAFFWEGPNIRYSVGSGFGGRGAMGFPSYEELMLQTDWEGQSRSYLASEANFRALKSMEERNLIVPIVGNFAGTRALRSVGRWVREHGAVVSAFYVSNVEQYLFQDGLFDEFARNVATMPLDGTSTFIRSVTARYGYRGTYLGPDGRASALDPIRDFVRDFENGLITEYVDVNARSR